MTETGQTGTVMTLTELMEEGVNKSKNICGLPLWEPLFLLHCITLCDDDDEMTNEA